MLAPRPHSREREQEQAYEATIAAALHLLNPLVFSISTRGSAEAVLAALVLGTLYCARGGMWARAAVGLGLSVHWKIYPVVYAAGVLGVVGRDSSGAGGSGVGGGETDGEGRGVKGFVRTLVNWRTVRFALISAATFFGLGFGCWLVYVPPRIPVKNLLTQRIQQMGIPVPLRNISLPPPPAGPPAQLLPLLLPDVPDLSILHALHPAAPDRRATDVRPRARPTGPPGPRARPRTRPAAAPGRHPPLAPR